MIYKADPFKAMVAAVLCMLGCCLHHAQAWQSDNGNGTYSNPVLYADYPDPDIIRVTNDFYMVSTTFADSPGINVLHSKDLVNWEIASHCATNLDWSSVYNLTNGNGYRGGFWAGSIRYYNGKFYVLANPVGANARMYYAANAAGPWQYYQLNQGAYDAGLFIETNGTGYIVEGHGPQNVMTLNASFSQVLSVSNNVVDSGGEGSHLVKKGNYYYLFNANPGIWPFQLRCSRATNIFGPWETGHICLTATTGGHQGGIVDLDNTGTNWFGFVHQDSGAIGRMTRVGPVYWNNNWPVFGTVSAPDQMATTYTKPVLGQPTMQPGTSDEFTNSSLGLQWQWNHNPDNTRWSLTERSGYLRLRPTQATNVWYARNTLAQKGQGPQSSGVVKFDLTNLKSNDVAGFGTLGKINGHIYVTADASGNKTLGMDVDNRGVGSYIAASGVPFSGSTLYLRTDLDFNRNLGICAYSSNGTSWMALGGQFPLDYDISYSTFQGEKFAISCYNPITGTSTGYVDVDSFTFTNTAPLVTGIRGRAKLNAARTTFVADNGQPLRGPYTSTEWTTGANTADIINMKNYGFNAIHLYAESFDPSYPTNGSTAPGYSVANVDRIVGVTRTNGLYLVITIGNGANNGNHNLAWATNFWNFYAPRYANETHVLFEIHNEPLAWGPPYLTGTTPTNTMALEINAYKTIRAAAPNTPVLLFSYAVFGGTGGTTAALTDIRAFNGAVFGNTNAVWTNEVVGFHGYGGWQGTAQAVAGLLASNYPCMMTEFGGVEWGGGVGLDVEMTSELERLGVSWTTFQYVPPTGVSDDVTQPEHYKDLVDHAGLSWTPDYGNWPVARSAYGNGGQPRSTTTNWVSEFLTGTNRIQAEDFDAGGEGVAYHDTWDVNQGGQYRTNEGVDIETTADTGGGYDVGWTGSGEWLEYTIWVQEPGYYNLRLRYASTAVSGVQVACNDRDKTGAWALPATGGNQTWATATTNVFLEFGRQKLRLSITGGAPNLNWFELSPSANAPIPNGIYKLVNRNTGQAMTYDTSNYYVVQSPYTGPTIQQWNLQHLGAGQYKISSAYNNDKWNGGALYGDEVGLTWWWGTDAPWQRAVVRPTGDGYYRVAMASFGLELEPLNGATTNGAPITATRNDTVYTGLPQQQWGILATNAPGIPMGLTATYASSSQINLTWNAVAGASGYNVKRSTVSGGPYTAIAPGVISTSYSDSTVTAGVKYYYVVSAVVGGVESLNSAEATAPNLKAYLKFDEITGTSAADSTGNGWNGTLVGGPTWVVGKFGNGVDLSGSSQYVTLPTGVVNGLTNFTIASWVYLDALNAWSRLFDFGNGTGTNMFLTPGRGGDGHVYFAVKASGLGEQGMDGPSSLPTNTWTHVAVTLSGTTATLYVNGVRVGQNAGMTVTPSSMGATTLNYIGKSQWADPYLNGRVDDFRIYGDALSALEIAALYAYQVPVLPATPSGLAALAVSSNKVSLLWNAATGATAYNVKRSIVRGGPYATIATGVTTTNYTDTGLVIGESYYYVVSASNANGESSDSAEATIPLPYPWQTQDVGAVGLAGSAAYSNGVFTATGSGADIWDAADEFRFVYLTNSGDCTITARVVSEQASDPWAKAGVMIRASLASNAPNAIVAVAPGNGVTFQWRSTTNGTSSYVNTTGLSAPYWVRLVRSGNTFAGYRSPDGTNWTQQGASQSITMGTIVYVGLAVTAHNDTLLCTAAFDNVTTSGWLAAAPPAAPAGLAAFAGNEQANLTWSASSGALSYNVFRSLVSGGPYGVVTNLATTNYTDTALFNGTNYYYVVSALNTAGESTHSTQIGVTPQMPLPPVPLGLAATAVSSSQINLVWNGSTNTASYSIKRSTTNGGPYTVIGTGMTATNYSDIGLIAGTTYYYVVSGVNGIGESTNSAQASATTLQAASLASVSVNAASTGVAIGAMHYGIFYEELNHAGNGGLWSELILNRSFENGDPLEGWTKTTTGGAAGTLTTDTNNQFNAYNKTELAVNVTAVGSGACGVYNTGFFSALPIAAGKTYACVVYARKASGFAGNLNVRLEDASGSASDTQTITNASLATGWSKFSFTLTASRTLSAARLAITTQSTGTFYLTYASLMATDTDDGFRTDLIQKLKDLKPGFVRFPGGCYVEGNTLANAWQWKGGVGPQEGRRTHYNGNWYYWDNNALGIYEYLILCEKLGAEPLFVANIGMSHSDTVTGAALQPYLQDALDAIEFANGATNTTWGAQRAALGHPVPFGLKYFEIGNENSGAVYNTNYVVFATAIRSNYPSVQLMANVWGTPTNGPVDIVDEHYYPSADWFAQEAHHFDSYSRTGPKVYVGEYAVTSGAGLGNLSAALGEATWMMGMERNADVVTMCSYAPLFTHVNGRTWNPDLICFDASSSYGTPSFYVQKMMAENRGDTNLATTASGPARTVSMLNGGVGVGTWITVSEYANVVVSNATSVLYQSDFTNNTTGWTPDGGTWGVTNGNLRQTTLNWDCRDVYYSPSWTNYTLTLKARKISGNEGFQVMFRATDHNNFYDWNLGGWGNTSSAVERCVNGGKVVASSFATNTIATNVWYDIKIVAEGAHIQCYLRPEGQANYSLVHDFTDYPSFVGFDAMATREAGTGDILVKVVNRTTNTLVNTPIVVNDANWPKVNATITTLTSGSDTNENSLANPYNVSPVVTYLVGQSLPLNYTFPPASLTILRLSPDLGNVKIITASAGTGGTISPSGSVLVTVSSNQAFTVAPLDDYTLADVVVDGVSMGAASNYTFFNVTANHTISASFAPIPYDSSSGLVHRYGFNATSGITAADSVGGPAWDGTVFNGGIFANGKLSLAPASQQYVNLPAGIVSGLSNCTIMAWVNLNAAATWNRVFDFGNSTTSYMFLTPQIDGAIRFAVRTNNGPEQQINCSAAVSLGSWHQVAVALSSGKGVLYLDGAPVGTNSSMTLNPASLGITTNNYIGKSQWADPYMDGLIDEFRIYSVGLSASEIAATAALGANQQLSAASPQMSLAATGLNLTVSWPLASAGFTLQSRTNLVLGTWLNVTSPAPQITGGQWQAVLSRPGGTASAFYRLVK